MSTIKMSLKEMEVLNQKEEEFKKEHYDELLREHKEKNRRLLEDSRLLQWVFYCIDKDKLSYFGITSQAEGSKQAVGLPFGMGKSSFMLWLMYLIYSIYLESRKNILIYTSNDKKFVWNIVFNFLWLRPKSMYEYFWIKPLNDKYYYTKPEHVPRKDLYKIVKLSDGSVPVIGLDDLQLSVSTVYSHDRELRIVGDALSTARHGHYKVCIGTCPKNMDLMRDFREAFSMFDIIIYDEGKFEFQKVHFKHTNFYDWLKISPKARYQSQGEFPSTPVHVYKRYERWYEREKRILHRLRFKEFRKPKILDNVVLEQQEEMTNKQLLRELRKKDEETTHLKKHLDALLKNPETKSDLAKKFNAMRWGKKYLTGKQETGI